SRPAAPQIYALSLHDALPICRFFEVSDRRSDAQVAIVNETFANRDFAGRSAIGAQFKFGNTGDKGYWYRIVGVVKEIHEVGMERSEEHTSELQSRFDLVCRLL